LLCLKNGRAEVKFCTEDNRVKEALQSLGIENTHLFFTRRILIVEGESEEIAVPILYRKYRGRNLHADLVTIINARGRESVGHIAKVIRELMAEIPLAVLVDSDYRTRPKTKELLEALAGRRDIELFPVGYKELEDAFDPEVIYEAIRQQYGDRDGWTTEAIEEKRRGLEQNPNYKFSGALEKLVRESFGTEVSKVEIAKTMARYCPRERIPADIKNLFDSLRS